MTDKPLLILAFNRPAHVMRLIETLRPHRPQKILIGIDGPRKNNQHDRQKISQVIHEFKKIDWTTDIEWRVRHENLGLRFAVADAVTWAIHKHGEVIVVEDDVSIGSEFFGFMTEMLDKFKNDSRVGHISGYNLVSEQILTSPNEKIRASKIPESYAWATWARAWDLYDPDLVWASRKSLLALRRHLGTALQAFVWKLNFYDALKENISTWAYRWTATLWSHDLYCISPNRNLVTYNGHRDGTHTRSKPKVPELEIKPLPSRTPIILELDKLADNWIQSTVFGATPTGAAIRLLQSLALRFLRILKSR